MQADFKPLASVIIPTYNRSTLLAYTLDSIVNQDLDRSTFEVIVADDGSADDTRAVVQRYQHLLSLRYCYQEDKGYRVASARNMGIRAARGTVLAFVDSGMVLSASYLRAHIRCHQQSAVPLAVIGYIYCFDHTAALESGWIDPARPDASMARLKAQQVQLDIREGCYRKCNDQLDRLPAPWVFFWTGNVSVKRETLRKTGPFDEAFDLTWGTEDVELGYRLHQQKVKFVLNRQAESIHYPHERHLDERFEAEIRNKLYFHQKHRSMQTELFIRSDGLSLNDDIIRHPCSAPEAVDTCDPSHGY